MGTLISSGTAFRSFGNIFLVNISSSMKWVNDEPAFNISKIEIPLKSN